MSAIFRRELGAFFTSGIAYVFLAVFYLLAGLFFYMYTLSSSTTDMSGMFSMLFAVIIFLIPILTMKSFSEEKKQITFVPFAKRMYTQVEVMISDEMSALEIVDRVETELSYRGRENIYEIVLTGSIDPQIHLDFYEITSQYMVTDIIYETKNQWEYEQLSEEDDFIIQKVADILKDEPEALRYAMEALTYAREK